MQRSVSFDIQLNWAAAVPASRRRAAPLRALGSDGVGFFGVDAQVFDGFVYDGGVDLAVLLEFVEGSQGDEAVVDLEEFAQGLAAFAAAKAVGAKRGEAARHPFADHGGQRLDVVGGGYERAGRVGQSLRDVRDARLFTGMQTVPALAFHRIGV